MRQGVIWITRTVEPAPYCSANRSQGHDLSAKDPQGRGSDRGVGDVCLRSGITVGQPDITHQRRARRRLAVQPVCARTHDLHPDVCTRVRFHWRAQADLVHDKPNTTLRAAEPYVIAVHPASKVLIVGLDAVRKSWEGTFDRFAEISVSMKEPQIHVAQKVAWVVGMEECAREVQQRGCRELHGLRKKGWALLMVLHTTSRVPQ